jgi:hypothetical protein
MVRVRHHTSEKVISKNAGLEISFNAGNVTANTISWA